MKYDSYMPVRLISARGAVAADPSLFSRFGDRCLIVTGGVSAEKSGALGDLTETLGKTGVQYKVFSGVRPNPETSVCRAAGAEAAAFGARFIVGVGGGSPMDAAKAVAIYAANPSFEEADIYTRAVPAAALPVLLVGTTAGTGSEVTGVSVLTLSATGKKKSISGPDCYAAVSFCDASYTESAPWGVTLSTALDAFAHAVESRLASGANELSALYAERAIALIGPFLKTIASPALPEPSVRDALYTASIYAGLAINITGTCFPHTVGYYLTENRGVPHGLACIAFMPELLRRAQKYCPEKLGAVEGALGMNSEALAALLREGVRFGFEIGAPEAAAAAFPGTVKNFARSPGGFTEEDARAALAGFVSDFGV
jgi:alcohol dehydrogenase class IV